MIFYGSLLHHLHLHNHCSQSVGDYGPNSTNEAIVASKVYGWSPELIITTGDNRYGAIDFHEAVGQFYCAALTDAGSGIHCSGDNSPANAFFPSLGICVVYGLLTLPSLFASTVI